MSKKLRPPPPPRHPLADSVSTDELIASLNEMLTPVVSVPPADYARWWHSMRTLVNGGAARILEGRSERVPVHDLAMAWLRLAEAAWGAFPVQEPER